MTRWLALMVVLLAATPAAAQRVSSVSGARLLGICTGPQVGLCDAFIGGVSDTVATADALPDHAGHAFGICIKREVTGRQLRETVVGWLKGHRDDADRAAVDMTLQALKAAYPCDKTG